MSQALYDVTRTLRGRVVTELSSDLAAGELSEQDQVALAERVLRDQISAMELPPGVDADTAVTCALEEMFGLGGFETWLARDDITDIWGQGHDRCFVRYADGTKEAIPPVAADDEGLFRLLQEAAASAPTPRRITVADPTLLAQLPDGSRLTAVIEVSGRPSFAIRRRRPTVFELDELVGNGTLSREAAAILADAVDARANIVIAGATGSGKTTLMRTLAGRIPPEARLVIIEDTRELGLADQPHHPDVVTLEAREANVEGAGEITVADLGRLALRLDPDRVFVGEVRGDEVIPMLTAMNQGNDGSMCTVHASSPHGALQKLALYAAMSPERLPVTVANLLIAEAVDLVVQVENHRGTTGRVVTEIHRVGAATGESVASEPVYTRAVHAGQPGD